MSFNINHSLSFRMIAYILLIIISFTLESVCFASDNIPFLTAVKTAVSDVAVITKKDQGVNKPPIVIFEERHDSRAGQIQQAMVLVRLHDKYGLNKIVLEGYLFGDQALDVSGFKRASKSDPRVRAEVACRLLKEGEISSVEFMKLVYDDVEIVPSEKREQHEVELDKAASRAPANYLFKIAQSSLTNADVPELTRLNNKIQNEPEKQKKQEHVQALIDYVFSRNAWANRMYKFITNPHTGSSISIEKHLSKMEEIANYPSANRLKIQFKPSETEAMQHNLAFWRARAAASHTMLDAAQNIGKSLDSSMIAMIIGAAHTELICSELKKSNTPFAVVTPLALYNKSKKGDLSTDILERKYNKLSVFSEGIYKDILTTFPPSKNKKPGPVINEDWFKAKSELYLFIHHVTNGILGPPSPPGGGNPPFGFDDDEFKGKFVFIDPKEIQIVNDKQGSDKKAVLFPVILNNDNSQHKKTIWVKSALGSAAVSKQEEIDVESMLKKALEGVEAETSHSADGTDKNKIVQITEGTFATFAESSEDAQKTFVSGV